MLVYVQESANSAGLAAQLHIAREDLSSGLALCWLWEMSFEPLEYSAWSEYFCIPEAFGHVLPASSDTLC